MLICTSCSGDFYQIATCQQNRILQVKTTYTVSLIKHVPIISKNPHPLTLHTEAPTLNLLWKRNFKQWRQVFQPHNAIQSALQECMTWHSCASNTENACKHTSVQSTVATSIIYSISAKELMLCTTSYGPQSRFWNTTVIMWLAYILPMLSYTSCKVVSQQLHLWHFKLMHQSITDNYFAYFTSAHTLETIQIHVHLLQYILDIATNPIEALDASSQ